MKTRSITINAVAIVLTCLVSQVAFGETLYYWLHNQTGNWSNANNWYLDEDHTIHADRIPTADDEVVPIQLVNVDIADAVADLISTPPDFGPDIVIRPGARLTLDHDDPEAAHTGWIFIQSSGELAFVDSDQRFDGTIEGSTTAARVTIAGDTTVRIFSVLDSCTIQGNPPSSPFGSYGRYVNTGSLNARIDGKVILGANTVVADEPGLLTSWRCAVTGSRIEFHTSALDLTGDFAVGNGAGISLVVLEHVSTEGDLTSTSSEDRIFVADGTCFEWATGSKGNACATP